MITGDEFGQLFLLSLAVFFGALLLLPLLPGIFGRIFRLVGLPQGLGIVGALATIVGLVVAGSLYLDTAGVVVPAQGQAKEERINRSSGRTPEDWWLRQLLLTVTYTTMDGRPTTTGLMIDEE